MSSTLTTWEFSIHIDCTVQYVHPPEDVRLAPYIFFCLDDAFKSKPIRVYLKNQQQQRSVRLGNNEPEPFRIKETLSIKFEDVVIDESCPFVQQYAVKDKRIVYETARLGIYVMSVDRDDNMVPCPFQAGAASIDLGSYFAGKISGAASGMESSIFSQGDIAPIGGVAIERLEITSSNDTSFADINLQVALDMNADFSRISEKADSGLKMQKNSKQTVMGYGERFHDWFQQSFRCDTPLSNRINCYFDFDVLGKRLPASFLLQRDPDADWDFVENLCRIALRRYAMRDQQHYLREQYRKLVDHNVTTTTNKYKTFAEWLDIGLMEGDLDDVLTRMYANMKQEERTRLLTEILTIIPTSFRYVGDHVILPNGKRIPVEDFDSPFETRTGDCVADYEEIYTLNGVKTVADIVVGDLVLSYDFADQQYKYKPVTKVWDKGVLPIYRVHFKNGSTIDVTKRHPMWARINKSGKSEYRKVYLEDIDMSHTWTRKVPTSIKLHYDAKDVEWLTEDHCFVIGHYLAEGWKEEHKVTTSGREIPDHIIPKLDALEIPYSLYSNNSGVPCLRFLKSEFKTYLHGFTMGSFKLKMPDELLNLPENKLQKLLDGYFLGDGHHHVQGGKKEMIYSTSSPDLVIQLREISLKLGKPFYVYKQEKHGGIGKKPIYRLHDNPSSFFRREYGYRDISEVHIVKVEQVGEANVRDFEVEDTHTYVFRNGILGHNCEDFSLAILTVYRAFSECKDVLKRHNELADKLEKNDGSFYYPRVLDNVLFLRVILHLQHLALLYVPLMCLDRVSIGDVTSMERGLANEDTISAHMNIMLVPVDYFVKQIRFDCFQHADAGTVEAKVTRSMSKGTKAPNFDVNTHLDQLQQAVKQELKLCAQNKKKAQQILQNIYDNIPDYTNDFGAKVSTHNKVVGEDEHNLRTMVAEGTGFFCSDATRHDPYKPAYKRVQELIANRAVTHHLSQMIYRPADEPLRSFFLNVLTCSTDLLLRKYGLPVCTFVMSYKEKGVTIARIDKNLPTISLKDNNKKKYLYGAEYMDFVYQKKNVIFVAAPIMTDEENKQAFFLARFRKPSPEFSRRKPDAIVYDSFDRSMLLDAVQQEVNKKTRQDAVFVPHLGDATAQINMMQRMLTQQTISGGSSKELIKTHVSGGNSILPCVYDEKTGRFYGSLSFVATAKQAKAKVTSTEEDKVSQRELYQLVASQNLDAKQGNLRADMEKLVRQKIAEINANVGSKERTIATGDRWQWTVHHIHPRSFIYGAFCDGIVALLKKPDVLEYAFAVESKLMHRLDIVTLCIKVRFQE